VPSHAQVIDALTTSFPRKHRTKTRIGSTPNLSKNTTPHDHLKNIAKTVFISDDTPLNLSGDLAFHNSTQRIRQLIASTPPGILRNHLTNNRPRTKLPLASTFALSRDSKTNRIPSAFPPLVQSSWQNAAAPCAPTVPSFSGCNHTCHSAFTHPPKSSTFFPE